MTSPSSLEDVFGCRKALVYGVGGSGDVVGCIPTARMLESHGVDVLLGGLAWEPRRHDPYPGPRPFDHIENLEKISQTVGLASDKTVTRDGVEFTETRVAGYFDTEVLLLDVSRGPGALLRGMARACKRLDLDLVMGVDAGGDVLARGDEDGLRSPVADALGLFVLNSLDLLTVPGVFGYGSDGELGLEQLERNMSAIMKENGLLGAWGLTSRVVLEMKELLEQVHTEASRLPVEAALGQSGDRTIRGGNVHVRLTPPAVVTFYFRIESVVSHTALTRFVDSGQSLQDLVERFEQAGYRTEF